MESAPPEQTGSWFDFTRSDGLPRALVQISVFVILLLLAWKLSHILLLMFGAIIVATILRGSAKGLTVWVGVPRRWSLLAAGLLLLALVVAAVLILGTQIATQLSQLGGRLTENLDGIKARLEEYGLLEHFKDTSVLGALAGNVTSFGSAFLGAIADTALVVVAGIYIAMDPHLYRRGMVMLFPPSVQPRIERALDASGRALGRWLLGQLIAMVIVGSLATIGLYLIGVPSPLALGMIAGVTEFIPYLGPLLGALPALLAAWSQGPYVLLWTALLYLCIQQFEAYVISPLLAREMVAVPPAVGLFSVVIFGVAFGAIGLMLAFPLAVVTMVLIVKLYLQPELGEDVLAPGESPRDLREER